MMPIRQAHVDTETVPQDRIGSESDERGAPPGRLQFVQQGLCVLQVGRIEALGEPFINGHGEGCPLLTQSGLGTLFRYLPAHAE